MRSWPYTILMGLLVGLALGLQAQTLDERWRRGRMAYQDGFHEQAIAAMQDVLAQPEAAPDVLHEAADILLRSYYEQSQWLNIRAFLAEAENLALLGRDARVYWQAVDAYGQEAWPEVLEQLSVLTETDDSPPPRVIRLRALAHLEMDDLSQAAEGFARLATMHPDPRQAARNRLDWGRVLESEGRLADAIAVWKPLLDAEAGYPRLAALARFLTGQAYFASEAYADAETVLAPLAQQLAPGDMLAVTALIMQARARAAQDDVARAREILASGVAALQEDPLRRRLEKERARLLLDAQEWEQGQQAVMQYVGRYADSPDAPVLLRDLGTALYAAGQYEQAAEVYQQHLEAFGDEGGIASHGRGLALRGAGRYAEAALAFERAFELAPPGPPRGEILLLAAQSRNENGQYRQALEWCQTYLDAYPGGTARQRVQFLRADSLAALGEVEEAVAVLAHLAQAWPESEMAQKAHLRVGTLYMKQQLWQQAESAFTQTMETYPEGALRWQALHGRGMARYHRWEAAAKEDFLRVSREAADTSLAEHARFMLAMHHFRLGQDEEAIALCESFLQETPGSQWAPDVRFRLAQFAYNAGRYETAEQAFLDFVDAHPEHALVPRSFFRAGLSAIRRQQFVQGIEILGKLVQRYPEHALVPYARFHQAEAMVQLGRYAAAILVYQEVIRQAPNSDLAYMAWGREGDCHFTLGADDPERYEAAARAYQVVLEATGLLLRDRLQAAYKLGLTYEKAGDHDAALAQYYEQVIQPFHLAYPDRTGEIGEEGRVWYARAVRAAAAHLEQAGAWQRLARLLDRAAGTDTEIAMEAARRARAIRSEYWWLFY